MRVDPSFTTLGILEEDGQRSLDLGCDVHLDNRSCIVPDLSTMAGELRLELLKGQYKMVVEDLQRLTSLEIPLWYRKTEESLALFNLIWVLDILPLARSNDETG